VSPASPASRVNHPEGSRRRADHHRLLAEPVASLIACEVATALVAVVV